MKIKKDEKGLKIGFTNGCFDVLHFGHIRSIERSKQHCDKLIIALNSDSSIKKLKARIDLSITSFIELNLSSLEFCDYVIIFNETTPLSIIKN